MVYEIMKEKKTKITIEMVMKLRSHSGVLTGDGKTISKQRTYQKEMLQGSCQNCGEIL